MEIWKDITGFENVYQVSNLGNVKSLHSKQAKQLKPVNHGDGYLSVTLYNNGFRKVKLIHHLVAEAFLNHAPNGFNLVIDHINDNPSDNRLENLQVVTHRFNTCKTQNKYASKFKGAYKSGDKWKSQIVINGKTIYLGTFDCELKAHQAYQLKLNSIDNESNTTL
jgi:hypothetical protein